MTNDHFQRLGLPRRFSVDPVELEGAYLARSRAVHPDYYLAKSASELAASLELSAALNEAYNTLKDPFARAEYLLRLEGGPAAGDQKQMPPAFLAEVLDLREQVEEARAAGPPDNPAVAALGAEFAARYDALLAEVGGLFEGLDRAPDRAAHLARIRGLLNAAKYVRGLIRDLHAD